MRVFVERWYDEVPARTLAVWKKRTLQEKLIRVLGAKDDARHRYLRL